MTGRFVSMHKHNP
uniref:Uncharacterized protein n=1 Tax=Anguilla anguilla TaxID=7936 RepID=A0A0E9PB27_ANGAN